MYTTAAHFLMGWAVRSQSWAITTSRSSVIINHYYRLLFVIAPLIWCHFQSKPHGPPSNTCVASSHPADGFDTHTLTHTHSLTHTHTGAGVRFHVSVLSSHKPTYCLPVPHVRTANRFKRQPNASVNVRPPAGNRETRCRRVVVV